METVMTRQGSPMKILVVDDKALYLNIYEQILTRLGYRVTTVTSGAAALELVKRESSAFDVVITDLAIKEMDGFTLRRKLRELDRALPVIAVASWITHPDYKKRMEDTFDGLLCKPFTLSEIKSLLNRVPT